MSLPDPEKISVESTPFNTETTGVSIEEKVDRIIATATSVKAALDRKTRTIIEVTGIVIAIALVGGAFLLWRQNISTDNSKKIAQQAYLQALVNNRDFLQYRRDFAETRDCPVEYFRDLLNVSREKGDLFAVTPPCEPADIPELDAKIAEINRKIAEATK